MSSNQQINPNENQMQGLLNLASKRMGTSPEELQQKMQSGNLDSILSGFSPEQRNKVTDIMNNPQAMQTFMNNPKVQQLLKGLMGNK